MEETGKAKGRLHVMRAMEPFVRGRDVESCEERTWCKGSRDKQVCKVTKYMCLNVVRDWLLYLPLKLDVLLF